MIAEPEIVVQNYERELWQRRLEGFCDEKRDITKPNQHGLLPELGDLVRLDKRSIIPEYNEKGEITGYHSPSSPYVEYMKLNQHFLLTQYENVVEIIRSERHEGV